MPSENRLALVGATLIDGTGRDPRPNAAVLVSGTTIERVGAREEVVVPPGYRVLDVSGKTLMPGLFDCHTHVALITLDKQKQLFTRPTVRLFQTAQVLKKTLHAGFTTVRELGGLNDVGVREAIEMGLIEGPRLYIAGGLAATGSHFDEYYPSGLQYQVNFLGVTFCNGVPEVQAASRKLLREGFDALKVCTSGGVASPMDAPWFTEWSPEELKAIVYEASARGTVVISHASGAPGIKHALRHGIWSIEHGSMMDEEGLHMLVDSGTYFVPTLYVIEHFVEQGKALGLSPVSMAKLQRIQEVHSESFRRAAEAGARIAVGTDVCDETMHGNNARELELMVQYGFTPMKAIMAATSVAAQVCRMEDRVGTVAPGKLADLLVVDGNPLVDIRILRDQSRMLMVMKEGTLHVDRLATSA